MLNLAIGKLLDGASTRGVAALFPRYRNRSDDSPPQRPAVSVPISSAIVDSARALSIWQVPAASWPPPP